MTHTPNFWMRASGLALAAVGLAGCAHGQIPPSPIKVQAAPMNAPVTQAVFRPPSVPLVTSDPFLSIWSNADHLTDTDTQHWTRRAHPLVSMIRVDGKAYRLMGNSPSSVPAFPQTSVQVTPTRSIYEFEDSAVHVTLTFMTAALPHDLDILSRPLSYLTWQVHSVDGRTHAVSLYDSTSSLLAVNTPEEPVEWKRAKAGTLTALRAGTPTQNYLGISGDDARLDWGYAYAAAPAAQSTSAIGASPALQASFVASGTLPAQDDTHAPRPANQDEPALAFAFNLGQVGAAPVSRHAIVAYDEVYEIKYFGKNLRPYWRRNGDTAETMLAKAERDYPSLVTRCTQFDQTLTADLTQIGGAKYAQMTALSYRQALAACGLAADANGQPLYFTKENNSNGDIGTVDIIFPMDPMLLLLSPNLAKATMVPIFSYAASSRWKFPNSPHDLGTYPVARGTDDGGEAMPVEESGNMLILADAIAHQEGSPAFASQWWPQLTQWAQYLKQYGNDPGDQLCTDDFMGHLAHNSNLSIKAIVALAAYGDLCRMRGDLATANTYQTLARGYAKHWMQVSGDGGDHYRLAFDKPNSWSQKYNLVWDSILNLHTFPPSVAATEIAYYKNHLDKFGLPLDSRTKITKTDWTLWTASMATSQTDFEALISPLNVYLNQTTDRIPFADGYHTDDLGYDLFHARPVIGGVFIRMLTVPDMWAKWSKGDTIKVGKWAALPQPPVITTVLATSKAVPHTWRYLTEGPVPADWTSPSFNDSSWKQGAAPFGHDLPQGIPHGTDWAASPGDLWLRRTITLPAQAVPNLQILAYHDEDMEVYVNGVLAAKIAGYNSGYENFAIQPAARALLKPGATVTLCAHVRQTQGGQGVDIGLANVTER